VKTCFLQYVNNASCTKTPSVKNCVNGEIPNCSWHQTAEECEAGRQKIVEYDRQQKRLEAAHSRMKEKY